MEMVWINTEVVAQIIGSPEMHLPSFKIEI